MSEKLANKRILTGLVSCVRVFGLFLRLMIKSKQWEEMFGRSVTLEDHQPQSVFWSVRCQGQDTN